MERFDMMHLKLFKILLMWILKVFSFLGFLNMFYHFVSMHIQVDYKNAQIYVKTTKKTNDYALSL
jgi:hypothetical protein